MLAVLGIIENKALHLEQMNSFQKTKRTLIKKKNPAYQSLST